MYALALELILGLIMINPLPLRLCCCIDLLTLLDVTVASPVKGTDFTKTSKYKAEFCQKFEEQGGAATKPVTSDMVNTELLASSCHPTDSQHTTHPRWLLATALGQCKMYCACTERSNTLQMMLGEKG
jgi:hypothetical protein